jgi:hypothetical protein
LLLSLLVDVDADIILALAAGMGSTIDTGCRCSNLRGYGAQEVQDDVQHRDQKRERLFAQAVSCHGILAESA